jgi:hypothetical protein
MPATILLPAALVLVAAERRFLALADDLDPRGGNAEIDEVVAHGAGAAFAQRQVVLGGPA